MKVILPRLWRCVAGLVLGAAAASAAAAPIVVATLPTAPFVLPKTDPPTGFSIALWQEIARRMQATTTWKTAASEQELLRMVQRGEADVGIAAIALTPQRDEIVDFSYPYFDGGLQIMVRAQNDGGFGATLASVPWAAIGRLFAIVVFIVFVLANILWLVERRRNGEFRKSYLRAIGEGLWGTMLIIATGEHGERDAPGVVKRIVVVCMWLLGVVIIAQLTATVTSSQTVERLRSTIQGPEDLPGKAIASVRGTPAGDYLARRGCHSRPSAMAPTRSRCCCAAKSRPWCSTHPRCSTGRRERATARCRSWAPSSCRRSTRSPSATAARCANPSTKPCCRSWRTAASTDSGPTGSRRGERPRKIHAELPAPTVPHP